MYTKNKNTISCPLCCRYNSTGEVCQLYHYRYAGSCQLVGGVAEPPADDCLHLFDVDPGSCGSFRDEACQYRGQVLLEKTSVTDYHSCQGLLQGLGPIYGASYFVYDSSPAPTGHRCRLYSSWERSCSAVMGPRYPDIDECHENHPISSSSTTTTPTTTPTTTLSPATTVSPTTKTVAPSSITTPGPTTWSTAIISTTTTTTAKSSTTTQEPISGCPRPDVVANGAWACQAGSPVFCYLNCDAGYASTAIIIQCNENDYTWSPSPSDFTCLPAIMMLVGGSGGRPGGPAIDPTAKSVELVSLAGDCINHSGPGNLPGPRTSNVAMAAHGKLLVCGGTDGDVDARDDCLVWNNTPSWIHHSYMNEGRLGGAAARVFNTLYVSGGGEGAEHLDPERESRWRYGPSLPDGVRSVTGHCSLPWGADGLLFIGGVYTVSEIIVSRDVLLYNTTTSRWSAWPSLLARRRNLACARLGGGTHILVAGGDNDSGDADVAHQSEILEVGVGTGWRQAGRLAVGRKGAGMAVVNGGRIVIAGGYSPEAATFLNTMEEFSLETEAWTMLDQRLKLPRGAYGLLTVPHTYC